MATTFSKIKSSVENFADGGSFTAEEHARWANDVRTDVCMDFDIGGFNGLFFLYKEATVQGGSVESQDKYAIPDDFIDHLIVFYDNTLLTPVPEQQIRVTQQNPDDGTPTWYNLLGVEFQLIPPPDTAAKEIKLLYNGLPSDIPSSGNDSWNDYFLNHWKNLHIFGITEQAWLRLGDVKKASYFERKLEKQKAKLMLHNRRHWIKNARLRYMNWNEYTDYKTQLFPQLET